MSESDSTSDADTPDDQRAKPRRWMPKLGGASVGAAMVGFEAAVFQTLPPPIEMVEHNRHDGPIVTEDGTMVTITLPNSAWPAESDEPPPIDE